MHNTNECTKNIYGRHLKDLCIYCEEFYCSLGGELERRGV